MKRALLIVCLVSMAAVLSAQKPPPAQTPTTKSAYPPGYQLTRGEITAQFRGNEYDPGKINGVDSLLSTLSPVDAYDTVGNGGGLDLEHFIGECPDSRNDFEPRRRAFLLTVGSDQRVILTRNWQDDSWQIGVVVTYHMVAPNSITEDVQLTPHDASLFCWHRQIVAFFANYMSPVLDVALHFKGVTGPGQPETWIAGNDPNPYTPVENWRAWNAPPLLTDPADVSSAEYKTYTYPRFTKPFYYGLSRNGMVYIQMFSQGYTPTTSVQFSLRKYKVKADPANPRPAWDDAFAIHSAVSGQTYGYRKKMVWTTWVSAADVEAQYDAWAAAGFPL